jgi:hemerythrin-like metal-binding protein
MALMTWNDSFSTGVRAMDEQHKGLVNTLNELHAAMLSGEDKAAAGPLLDRLVKYTHEHFVAEEVLMTKSHYPRLLAHTTKHRDLTGQVETFVGRYQRGELSLNVDLLMFLRDWLITHIQKEDREYGPWMNQNGIR